MEQKKNQISTDSIFYICFGSTLIGIGIGNFIHQSVLSVLAPLAVATISTVLVYKFRSYKSNKELMRDTFALAKDLDYEKEQSSRYKHFAEAIIQGQEHEKKRLALELHDDTIQRLIIIGQRTQLISLDQQDKESQTSGDLAAVQSLIDESIQSIRLFIKQLRPTYLDKLGLVPTLGELATQVNDNSEARVKVDFESTGEPHRFDGQIELALYRIAQSAVSNAVRHSGGDTVILRLDFLPETIDLSIEDNGKGFHIPDEISLLKKTSFGLMGMQERADFIGAEFSIHTGPKGGTKVLIRIPSDAVNAQKAKSKSDNKNISVGHLV